MLDGEAHVEIGCQIKKRIFDIDVDRNLSGALTRLVFSTIDAAHHTRWLAGEDGNCAACQRIQREWDCGEVKGDGIGFGGGPKVCIRVLGHIDGAEARKRWQRLKLGLHERGGAVSANWNWIRG